MDIPEVAPVAPQTKSSPTTVVLIVISSFMGCITLVVMIGVIATISAGLDSCSVKRDFADVKFTTSGEVQAFINDHDIEYKEKGGTWKAKHNNQQGILDELHAEYWVLKDEEGLEQRAINEKAREEEAAREKEQKALEKQQACTELASLLDNTPECSFNDYAHSLYLLEREAGDVDLSSKVEAKLTEIEPDIAREDIFNVLAKPDINNRRKYIVKLEGLLERAPDRDSRLALEEAISSHTDIIDKEEMLGPKPENSAWDASVKCVKDYMKDYLKDPKSVEYMEWSPVFEVEVEGVWMWCVRVKYRAKNSFGGYVIEEKLAYIMHGYVLALEDYQ